MKLTVQEAKDLARNLPEPVCQGGNLSVKAASNDNPFKVGLNYFIRTVTHAHTGKVKSICGQFLTLENAAWIADTGRFYDALKNTDFDEVEPFTNDLILNMDSIIDATPIDGELPTEQK